MEIIILPEAKKDLDFWIKSGNRPLLKKITQLIESIQRHPFEGIGKPEPLKHELKGTWSRRIDRANRLIYEIENNKVIIHSLKGHYD